MMKNLADCKDSVEANPVSKSKGALRVVRASSHG
jgi:hypothetical protein